MRYFVYTVIAIHIGPDLLQLSFQVSVMVQKMNLTLFTFMLSEIKLKLVSILEKYQRSIILRILATKPLLRWQIKFESVSQLTFENGTFM